MHFLHYKNVLKMERKRKKLLKPAALYTALDYIVYIIDGFNYLKYLTSYNYILGNIIIII